MLVLITKLFGRKPKPPAWPPKQPLGEIPDETLMEWYAAGRVEAFEVLLKRHQRAVYHFILRSVSDAARAEDLTQEVFYRVIKNADRYTNSAKFRTWLFTIARNICIDRARRKSTKLEVSLDKPKGDSDDGHSMADSVVNTSNRGGTSSLERKAFKEKLVAALDTLPADQREVFLMRQVSGLKFREISKALKIPENTVKSRMRYALSTLRMHLEEFKGYSFDAEDRDEVGEPCAM